MTNLLLALILFVLAAALFPALIAGFAAVLVLLFYLAAGAIVGFFVFNADIDWVSVFSDGALAVVRIIFGLFALAFVVGLIIGFFKPENLLPILRNCLLVLWFIFALPYLLLVFDLLLNGGVISDYAANWETTDKQDQDAITMTFITGLYWFFSSWLLERIAARRQATEQDLGGDS